MVQSVRRPVEVSVNHQIKEPEDRNGHFLGTTRSDDRTERDTPTKDTIDDDH